MVVEDEAILAVGDRLGEAVEVDDDDGEAVVEDDDDDDDDDVEVVVMEGENQVEVDLVVEVGGEALLVADVVVLVVEVGVCCASCLVFQLNIYSLRME
ncbi:hypothetical protein Lal_00005937 [Lupinus albus]|nr:hypothetical protein Lal_00005937 [Lupinus albus]